VQLQIGLRLKARLEEEKAAEICLERAGVPVSQIEMLKKKSTRQLVNLAKKASDLEVSVRAAMFSICCAVPLTVPVFFLFSLFLFHSMGYLCSRLTSHVKRAVELWSSEPTPAFLALDPRPIFIARTEFTHSRLG
jgi:hypothetical protein